jgi:hypothetical protein
MFFSGKGIWLRFSRSFAVFRKKTEDRFSRILHRQLHQKGPFRILLRMG